MSEQKTEQASAQRKQKARKQGDGVRSRELVAALAMLAGVLSLGVAAKTFAESWSAVYANSLALGFRMARTPMDTDALVKDIVRVLLPGLLPLVLVLGACLGAALFAGTAQAGGISIHPEALSLKMDRLNPVTNIKHLFSLRSAARLGKSLIPAGIMVAFGYQALMGLIRQHAHSLLGRSETKRLLDALAERHPKLVEELVPKQMTLGEVQKVLQQLLREAVSIRDLGAILEVLVEASLNSKTTVHLVESVRQALGRRLVAPHLDADGGMRVLVLDAGLEEEIVATFDPEGAGRLLGDGARANPSPGAFLRRVVESVKRLTNGGNASAIPVLLCPSPARYHLRRWLEPFLPRVTVLSPGEIPPEIRVRSAGTLQ